MIQLLVAGAQTLGSSGALGKIETNWFGGGARDDARQQRVNWFVQAAIEGSVIAARIVLAGPANVAGNEDPMWIAGAQTILAQRPDVMNAARSQTPYWDSTDNATSDKMRALVNDELRSIGGQSPGYLPTTSPVPPIFQPLNKGIAETVQNVTAGGGAQLANAIDPNGGYTSLPLNYNRILVGLLVLGLVVVVARRSAAK